MGGAVGYLCASTTQLIVLEELKRCRYLNPAIPASTPKNNAKKKSVTFVPRLGLISTMIQSSPCSARTLHRGTSGGAMTDRCVLCKRARTMPDIWKHVYCEVDGSLQNIRAPACNKYERVERIEIKRRLLISGGNREEA